MYPQGFAIIRHVIGNHIHIFLTYDDLKSSGLKKQQQHDPNF